MKPQFIIGSFGIIFDERKRVLLVHRRDYDLWNLPGGTLEDFESPKNAVIREVKEETGLDVKVSKLLGVYNKENKNDMAFSFLCEAVGGKITLNDEADRIEYFEVDKLPANSVPKQVERIKDALSNPSEIIFKTQSGKSAIELVKEGKL
ncbi:MAG: NUDIX domain-containing protein [Candidatus Paceibacterota bacterium]|jgi:ADP-ribose pyrophosphatase YjhB (NUDIX family)